MSLHIKSSSVLFDTDGTLYNTAPLGVEKANHLLHTTFTVMDYIYYTWLHDTIRRLYKKAYDITLPDPEITDLCYGNDVLSQADPMPGMQRLVSDITAMGIEVNACTARRKTRYEDVTRDSIRRDYPQIKDIFMRSENYLNSLEFKSEVVFVTNPVLVVDDYAEMILQLADIAPAGTHFAVVDSYWNQDIEDEEGNPITIGHNGQRIRRVGNRETIYSRPNLIRNHILKQLRDILGQ